MRIIIATIKSWNIENAEKLKREYAGIHEINILTNKEDLTKAAIEKINPDYIFFPHWSFIIPEEIYENYQCVVFHMTDLPFGRGGSPLQNLIVRGITETKISALRVEKDLDAGPIYLKEALSLEGSADEIFRRASDIIFTKMIPVFLKEEVTAKPQEGEVVIFKRRKPADSELKADMNLEKIYDYIRMLDAEGYPNAFVDLGDYRISFTNAVNNGNDIEAKVIIRRKDNE